MRQDLLDILECPTCRGTDLVLEDPVEGEREIRTATVKCPGCGAAYGVSDGIVTILPPAMESIYLEMEAWSSRLQLGDFDDAMHATYRRMMMTLPFIEERYEPDTARRVLWWHIGYNFQKFALGAPLEGKMVLDVGAGRCWSTALLASRGARAVALDTLTKLYMGLETADVYIDERGIFFERVQGDMHQLPFRDGTFDLVTESESAHHAADTALFFSEVRRVLKPGGRFALVSEHFALEDEEPPPDACEGATEMQIGISEWFALFARSGLVPVRCEVSVGRGFSCLLARKGDRHRLVEAAGAAYCRFASECNYRAWQSASALGTLLRRVLPVDLKPHGRTRRRERVDLLSLARRAVLGVGLPTSPRVLLSGDSYRRALATGAGAPSEVRPGVTGDEQWLGRGWYPPDPRLEETARRCSHRADLVMSIPAGAKTLTIEAGLPGLYRFETPLVLRVRVGGRHAGNVELHRGGMDTHILGIPPGVGRDRSQRVSLHLLSTRGAGAIGYRARGERTIGMVVKAITATTARSVRAGPTS